MPPEWQASHVSFLPRSLFLSPYPHSTHSHAHVCRGPCTCTVCTVWIVTVCAFIYNFYSIVPQISLLLLLTFFSKQDDLLYSWMNIQSIAFNCCVVLHGNIHYIWSVQSSVLDTQVAFDFPLQKWCFGEHPGTCPLTDVYDNFAYLPRSGINKAYMQNCIFNLANCSHFLSRMASQSTFPLAVMRAPTSFVPACLALSSSLLFAGPMGIKWYPIITLIYIFKLVCFVFLFICWLFAFYLL